MPHFVVDCSKSVLSSHDGATVTKEVHLAAVSTGLFGEANVQVRINSFDDYLKVNEKQDFIQVVANILEGRTAEQKIALSETVVTKLVEMFPNVPVVGMDILNVEKGTGFNKNKLLAKSEK